MLSNFSLNMSIILRMNGLPTSATSLDVRRFFKGIRIPDGGVHIIGGPESSVFIALNDDVSATKAMKMADQMLLDHPIKINLSSRNEMKNLIKTLFECALIQENSGPMSSGQMHGGQMQSMPNIDQNSSRYPPSQLPPHPPLPNSAPLLPFHSSNSGNPINHPPYEDFEGNFDSPPNQYPDGGFGGPPPPWAGPSGSNQFRPEPIPNHAGPPNQAGSLLSGPAPPLPSNNSENARRLTVEVHRLPFGAGVQDIINFFYPLVTEENVKLVEDERSFPTGVALVRLSNLADFNHALEHNGKLMDDKPILIKPLVDQPHNRPGPPPMGPSPQSFPLGPPHGPPQPLIGKGPGPPMNSFYGPPDCRFDVPFDQPFPGPQGPIGPPLMPGQKPVVYMKGLPFELCKIPNIYEFFRPLNIAHIELENDNRGRLAGNAYVEFLTMNDYNIACKDYHMRHMGTRYIEVLPVNSERVRSYCIHIKNMPPCTFDDVDQFLGSFNFVPARIHHNPILNEAYVEFLSAKEQIKAVENIDGKFWDGIAVSVSRIPFQVMMKKMNEAQSTSEPPSRQPNPSSHRPLFRERSPPNGPKRKRARGRNNSRRNKSSYGGNYNPFEDKKSVLIAIDCDPRVRVEDFCDFFENYGVDPNMVDIRDTNSGMIDAHIAFHNHFDAKDALENMNRELFLGKPIHLRPA